METKTVTVLRPCSQAGRQRCVSCKREHQRACMGVHAYIQWAHYVCASWDEVRARVHARGHTQRERRTSVCAGGARLSLPHSHAATTAAAAAHAKRRRSKRGEVVWETAVLPSLSPVVAVVVFVTVASTGVSFGLAFIFSFCFSSRVSAPSAAGSLFGMPSSVVLSASLLAGSPFAVGDGGLDPAWLADGSFCCVTVMRAPLFACEFLFGSMPSRTFCGCCTVTLFSGLDCPSIGAAVESPARFSFVVCTSSAVFAGSFVGATVFISFCFV
ncbi:hypothetical protein ECC02_006850 [Trypanosoma cruzi]|uniref:Nucleolar RNA helicase II n=1 Tax=Trypanosoma cruzi TaxID=5693 RepID=A0A7J6Y088_TRYCR|nr:hypothetical protein ECC02_006850 [Trypanosoma cruzi]